MGNDLSLRRALMSIGLLAAAGALSPAYANTTCVGNQLENGVLNFQLPAIIRVDPDLSVGSIIYEDSIESGRVEMECQSTGNKYKGYVALTDSDGRNGVMEGVYQTNVPGIGIRMAQAQDSTATFTSSDIITPMHFVSYGGSGWSIIKTTFHGALQLVVTGEVKEGYLDTSRLTAEERWGKDVVAQLLISPGSVQIVTASHTCNLVDKNIYVPLKTVNAGDFDNNYSDILTDERFKISLTECSADTRVDFRFTSSGSTGVTNGHTLNIADSAQAASGIGIQILDKNNTLLTFDQDYTATTSTGDKEAVDIPLKARYIKTGDVRPGKVDAVATFDVFYR